jgi:hypothetical protein
VSPWPEAAVGERAADRLFDFTLRGDPDFFEKFADADIEHVFIHDRFSQTPETWRAVGDFTRSILSFAAGK